MAKTGCLQTPKTTFLGSQNHAVWMVYLLYSSSVNTPWFQIARISGMKNEIVTGQYFTQTQLIYKVTMFFAENVGTVVAVLVNMFC